MRDMKCSRCEREIKEGEERQMIVKTYSGIYTIILCKECFDNWGKIEI